MSIPNLKDIAERTFWTGAEAAIAYAGTRLADIGPEWVLVGAPILAVIKGWIATHVGDKTTASVPSVG